MARSFTLDVLIKQGQEHEAAYVEFLAKKGLKVPGKSKFGNWSYEVQDTKLAQNTRAATILHLCLYTDLLATLQESPPEKMYVVKPGDNFPTEEYRFAEFHAYYRLVKKNFEQVMAGSALSTYPDPVEHCNICRWWQVCDQKRHDDDHLSLVAGIRSLHIVELQRHMEKGNLVYKRLWSTNRVEERIAFEQFMQYISEHWKRFPKMHIYHFDPYEQAAIKRLAHVHATFEKEMHELLRAERFIDLHAVFKEALLASVESYSLKELEKFTQYSSKVVLHDASVARKSVEVALELNDFKLGIMMGNHSDPIDTIVRKTASFPKILTGRL